MKIISLFFLLFITVNSFSQFRSKAFVRSGPVLLASKGDRRHPYRLGTPIRMIVSGSGERSVVKGYITHFENDMIAVESFRKDTSATVLVKAGDIEKIRFLSRRGRKQALIALGAGGIYAGIMAAISHPGPFQYVIFIPAMAAGFFFVYYFPFTYVADCLFQKSSKRGWSFEVDLNY